MAAALEMDGRIEVGLVGRPRAHERVPVLAERAHLARQQEPEVGLVVGEDAGHQLDVRPVLVGQLAVPGVAELVVAPGPLLLAGTDGVVGPVHEALAGGVVVAAEEVLAVPMHMYEVGTGMLRYQRRSASRGGREP